MFKTLTTNYTLAAAIISTIFLTSCASTYKPINFKALPYTNKKTYNDVEFSYVHNIQFLSDNAWYTKKEKKFAMVAVAISITNNSQTPFVLTPENFKVLSADGIEKKLLSPDEYTKKVKQRTGRHMLHALWGPWAISWSEDQNGNTDTNFIYLPVGAIVGLGNAIRANNANNANLTSLKANTLWDRIVKPGETVTGTILIPGTHFDELKFDLVK